MKTEVYRVPLRGIAALMFMVVWAGAPPGVQSATGSAENVVWTDPANVTAGGNSLEKTSGCDGCEDAGAVSQPQIVSGDDRNSGICKALHPGIMSSVSSTTPWLSSLDGYLVTTPEPGAGRPRSALTAGRPALRQAR